MFDFVYCYNNFLLNSECLNGVAYDMIDNKPRLDDNGVKDFLLKWFYLLPVSCGQVRRGVDDDYGDR